MLPFDLLERTLYSAFSPPHLEVAEQKASYEFDMTPELSQSMWRLQNGEATRLLTVEVQVPRPPGSGGKGASA